jgi:predicted kinase
MRREAGVWLRRGVPVVLDGTFGDRPERDLARTLARRAGAEFRLILVEPPDSVRRSRIRARQQDPARVSDADWRIAEQLKAGFERPTEIPPPELLVDPSGGGRVDAIIERLSKGLIDPTAQRAG